MERGLRTPGEFVAARLTLQIYNTHSGVLLLRDIAPDIDNTTYDPRVHEVPCSGHLSTPAADMNVRRDPFTVLSRICSDSESLPVCSRAPPGLPCSRRRIIPGYSWRQTRASLDWNRRSLTMYFWYHQVAQLRSSQYFWALQYHTTKVHKLLAQPVGYHTFLEMTLYAFAKITPKPEHYEDARRAILGIMNATKAEEGCLQFDLFEDSDEQQQHLFLEEAWASETAFAFHHRQEYTKAVFASYQTWLAQPVEIHRMQKISP